VWFLLLRVAMMLPQVTLLSRRTLEDFFYPTSEVLTTIVVCLDGWCNITARRCMSASPCKDAPGYAECHHELLGVKEFLEVPREAASSTRFHAITSRFRCSETLGVLRH
jgi:hypothetical protein